VTVAATDSEPQVEARDGGSPGDGMAPVYRPAEVEPGIYQRWLDADVFAPDGAGSRADWSKAPFTIIMPPPNVTGALHLGHAQRATVEDALIRRARMQCRPTLWLPGKDHASISAQFVLDRIIAEEGETRESLGRERYLERMWRFVEETRDVMTRQLYRVGASADWSRERFTLDEGSARAVRVSFKRLWDDGLVYRAEALINWCPGCRTSLSDLEVLPRQEKGTLWSIRYHLADEQGQPDPEAWVTVATTRPETLLGDTAVAVHPEDRRYRELVGGSVVIPFVDRVVPIVADDVVEQSFGTGAVKITPAHDHADYETGQRHHIPIIDVMNDDGTINQVGGPYAGLDRFEARRRILADLETRGDLAGAVAHELVIGHCDKSDDIVEPRLKTQWFLRTQPMAAKAMAAVREDRTRIVPKRFEKVFFGWLENIRDWNVSRQLWWGHRIPAWYCPDGHVTVSDESAGPRACETCGRPAAELRQEEEIFDTWYSSGLWPFSTLGWPDETPDLERFYPGSVMETAYDILFFWVARMMMLGEWLTGREPFEVVLLSGLIRDPFGKKMSKTRGNVVDPLSVIDEIGADSLRFAVVNGVTPGNDLRLGPERLETARNFANKLWNAARFVTGSRPAEVATDATVELPESSLRGPAEAWILQRLERTADEVSRAYEDHHLGEAARLLYEAIWGDYCDWYLELAKAGLSDEQSSPEHRRATWQVLAWTLDRYLRLLHPLMPFITEAIWQRLPHGSDEPALLIVADWPEAESLKEVGTDGTVRAARGAEELIDLVRSVRNARAEGGIEPGTWLAAEVHLVSAEARLAFEALSGPVERLSRLRPITLHATRPQMEAAAPSGLTVISGPNEARISRGEAEQERERARLDRELGQVVRQLESARARLADEAFVARAPAQVVDAARTRLRELEALESRLRGRLGAD
jgi:valyl-tRNA synthetase